MAAAASVAAAAAAAAAAEAAQRQSALVNSGGWLQKPGRLVGMNWKRRHMQLEKHHSGAVVLAYFETKGGKQKGEFELQAAAAGGGGGGAAAAAGVEREGETGFRVLSGGRTFRLRAETAAEADDWVAVLRGGAVAVAERLAAAERRRTLHLPADATAAQCEAAELRRRGLKLPTGATVAECEAAEREEAARAAHERSHPGLKYPLQRHTKDWVRARRGQRRWRALACSLRARRSPLLAALLALALARWR
jgi:hypothetical protein